MKLYFTAVLAFVSFLMYPEDSTAECPGELERYPGVKRYFAGTVKAIFWTIISLAAGLGISKL